MQNLESGPGKQVYIWEHMAMFVVHLLFPRRGLCLLPIASWILIL